jgi:hypothetical protein
MSKTHSTPRPGAGEPVRLSVTIDYDVWYRLRLRVLQCRTTATEFVAGLIEDALSDDAPDCTQDDESAGRSCPLSDGRRDGGRHGQEVGKSAGQQATRGRVR